MKSNICEFYSGKSVFITGATGFLGKTLVEKLVRSCDGIDRIYILMRHKKGMTAKERSLEFKSDPIFDLNGLSNSGVCNKIEPIFGDTSLPEFGISCEDRQLLTERVNVVIHLAASVNLNATLRSAIESNLKPIKALIDLCHQIERLDCLVYASTIALLNCTGTTEEAILNNLTVSPDYLIKACDNSSDKELTKMRKFLFSEFNNTYCISKALAEKLLAGESHRLNIAIIRPSVILSAYSQPVPGWVQGLQTSISAITLVGLGVMRIFPTNADGTQCQIPVDFVSNAIIASSWFVSNTNDSETKLQVFHLTTKKKFTPSLRYMWKLVRVNAEKYPSKRVVRPPGVIYSQNKIDLYLNEYIKHWFFAHILQLIAKLNGNKSNIIGIMTNMNKYMKDITTFFQTSHDYDIENTLALIDSMSELDRKVFYFDVRKIDWKYFSEKIWLGARRYVLKENDDEISDAKKIYKSVALKYVILNFVWLTTISILLCLIGYFITYLFGIDFYLPSILSLLNPTSVLDFIQILIILISLIYSYRLFRFMSL